MRQLPHSLLVIGTGAAAGLVIGIAIACGGSGDGDPTPAAFVSERETVATATATSAPAIETATATSAEVPTESPPTIPPPTEDVDGTTVGTLPCGDILVPINKQNALSSDCAPGDLVALPAASSYGGEQYLRQDAAIALNAMFEAAAAEGIELFVSSSYRSYSLQVSTYGYWVDTLGQAEADRISARPGHSEHQLGTTVDLTSASVDYQVDESFGASAEGQWVAANAWAFGFVISYPAGGEGITGYAYEPWHIRYLGEDVAAQIASSGMTTHEFLIARAGG